MKRKLLIIFISLFIISLFMINNMPVKAAGANIRYVLTSVGETPTEIGINYQADVEGTELVYSTSQYFTADTTKTVKPTVTTFSAETTVDDPKTGYAERYICKVNLTGLAESTKYYYKVKYGAEQSEVFTFTTGSTKAAFNFIFTSDLHSSSGWNTMPQGNACLTNALKATEDANLLLMTGDQVERGGYEAEWQAYYNGYYSVQKDLVLATIPGNHEYYHDSGAGYISALYYNQFFNNPQNGPEKRLNSTYYFKYGTTLFIMLDCVKQEYISEQKAWFEEVVKANPSQWIVVASHPGCITCGAYKSDAQYMKNTWQQLFEKYQVDLAISGHEHIYIRNDLAFGNSKSELNGVTYLVTPSGALKQYAVQTRDPSYTIYQVNNCVEVVNVTAKSLTCTLYDNTGKPTEYTFTLSPKRNASIINLSDTALVNQTKTSYDKENAKYTVSWASQFYGVVDTVEVNLFNENVNKTYSTYIASSNNPQTNITVDETQNYDVKITLHKKNGSTIEVTDHIQNVEYFPLHLELDGGEIKLPGDWSIYGSGVVTVLPTPKLENATFVGWYNNPECTGDKITRISADMTGELTFYAKWLKERTIKFVTNSSEVINDITYKEGEIANLPTPTEQSDKTFEGWYDNAEFTGESLDYITEETRGDKTLYAKWKQIETPTPGPNENPEPTPPQKKKGCKKNIEVLVSLISVTTVLAFVLRKKH